MNEVIASIAVLYIVNLFSVVGYRDVSADLDNNDTVGTDPRYRGESGIHALVMILVLSVTWPLYGVWYGLKAFAVGTINFIEWLQSTP